MPKKNVPIDYTSRDFATIKEDLVEFAKRYYPETYKDFNEAGFGALMLDTVAYVGDILSFYLDYQVNESFIDTATEYNNILSLGKQVGYKVQKNPSSRGIVTFFVIVPANSAGTAPDARYIPILKKGSGLTSASGAAFILEEDVNFVNGDTVVATTNTTNGQPLYYAIKSYGAVSSGEYETATITVGEFQRFRKETISDSNITEIISVVDDSGNEYYEVDYLTQNTILRSSTNRDPNTRDLAAEVLKPLVVPRRFTAERVSEGMVLQFGSGKETDDSGERVLDPSNVALQLHAKEYISDTQVDPTRFLDNTTMGVAPSNTTLTITYRRNTKTDSNVAARTMTAVSSPIVEFVDVANLSQAEVRTVRNSFECINEDSITGFAESDDVEELRLRVMNTFSSQRRAVTLKDYEAMAYAMPPKFGKIKRVRAIKNPNPRRGNVSIATISEDSDGALVASNAVLKDNLATWLDKSRMMTDAVDIVDAKIINLQINFSVVGDVEKDSSIVLQDCIQALVNKFSTAPAIGEHFYITDVYKELKDVAGVVDVVDVSVQTKRGADYANIAFQVEDNLSDDGRSIIIPRNAIYEIKFPSIDIKGAVR